MHPEEHLPKAVGRAHEAGKELGEWDFKGYAGMQGDGQDVAI